MDSCQLSAVEYFDPNDTLKQPNCDLKSIVSKLEVEFASSLKTNQMNVTNQPQAEKRFHDKSEEIKNDSVNSSSQIDEEFDCECWSSKVDFVSNSSIWKLGTQDPSRRDISQSEISLTKVKQEKSEISQDSSDQVKPDPNEQPELMGTRRLDESIQAINVITNDTSLNSFAKFLRFFHQVYCHFNTPSEKLDPSIRDKELSNASNGAKLNFPTDEPRLSSSSTKSNDLLEAIIQYPELYDILRDWNLYQDAQCLLGSVCTAALLVGNRVRVYRTSGTTQWYTAVIISYDERTNLMTLIDDTVLEQHHEDPTLLEMHLIDGGLIQSIIEGDDATSNVGSTRRRTQRSNQRQAAQVAQQAIMNSSTIGSNSGSISAGPTSAIIKQPARSSCLSTVSPAPSVASSSSSSAFSIYQQHMSTDTIDQSQSSIDNRIIGKRNSVSKQHTNKVSSKSKRKRLARAGEISDETGKSSYICRNVYL